MHAHNQPSWQEPWESLLCGTRELGEEPGPGTFLSPSDLVPVEELVCLSAHSLGRAPWAHMLHLCGRREVAGGQLSRDGLDSGGK